ncbi:Gfo/Idh/MocA family protein [Lactovum odontotermitis]
MTKAAIWGAGNIANLHAQALRSSGVELVAVVDNYEESARRFAENWQIPNFGTDKEILFDEKIQTVHVCTPPNLHYQMVKELLLHKKNVICEKPLCFSSEEADELYALAEKNNLKCAVNFNVRYYSAIKEIKQQVRSVEFGKTFLVHGEYLQSYHLLPTDYTWRYNPELAGEMRAVTEIGTHWFDLIEHVTNQQIVRVSAKFGKFNPLRALKDGKMLPSEDVTPDSETVTVNSEDAALITFELENGAIGSVVLSEVSHGKKNQLKVAFTGAHGTVTWNSQRNNEFNYAHGREDLKTSVDAYGNAFGDTFMSLINDFYAENSSDRLPDIKAAGHIVKLCNTVYESDRQNGAWLDVK